VRPRPLRHNQHSGNGTENSLKRKAARSKARIGEAGTEGEHHVRRLNGGLNLYGRDLIGHLRNQQLTQFGKHAV
jgi:hypothetical protein